MTSLLKMDGWKTIVSFWDGQFSGAFWLVSGSVYPCHFFVENDHSSARQSFFCPPKKRGWWKLITQPSTQKFITRQNDPATCDNSTLLPTKKNMAKRWDHDSRRPKMFQQKGMILVKKKVKTVGICKGEM